MYSMTPLSESFPNPPVQEWIPATVEEAFILYSGPAVLMTVEDMCAWPGVVLFELSVVWQSRSIDDGPMHPTSFGQPPSPGRLRLGLELHGGTLITGRLMGENWGEAGDARLYCDGSSGGGGNEEMRFVALIEPPGDDVHLVTEWPDRDVPLTRHALSATRIREAMGRAQRAFPAQ